MYAWGPTYWTKLDKKRDDCFFYFHGMDWRGTVNLYNGFLEVCRANGNASTLTIYTCQPQIRNQGNAIMNDDVVEMFGINYRLLTITALNNH